ncbi:hypothetical protein PINS_up004780 [Pythium insidiosum]|nr:hypothetical protein PINS_up004780 [Pythium insidiosum]
MGDEASTDPTPRHPNALTQLAWPLAPSSSSASASDPNANPNPNPNPAPAQTLDIGTNHEELFRSSSFPDDDDEDGGLTLWPSESDWLSIVGELSDRSGLTALPSSPTSAHGGHHHHHSYHPPRRRRRALVWFRKDLRLHDNLALHAALQTRDAVLLPVYIIHRPVRKRCGAVRFQFLLECLEDLAKSLQSRGSRLIVLRGDAMEVLKTIIPAWGITDLFFEDFVVPYAVTRDEAIKRTVQELNVKVTTVHGRTLYDPKVVLKKSEGRVLTDFSQFMKIVQELPQPAMPIAAPPRLPEIVLSNEQLHALLDAYCRSFLNTKSDHIAGSRRDPFAVPKLEDFGYAVPATHSFLYGGETIALTKLDDYCADEKRVGLFEKPKTSPACIDTQSTTTLSPYITFGCLSPREFFYRVMFIQLKFPGRQGPPAVTLDGQLMWREFFYCFGVGVPSFDTQENNPMCMQVNWKLQDLPQHDGDWDEETTTAMEQLRAWMEGRTGFPWIDAVMRQIEQEGWAHHVARHAVACFLTRGDLYISWLRGAYFFQEKLIDLDWPINIGNWLWVSSSCFFHDYHLIHSPSLFIQSWDPQGRFIRKYIPELRKMPARYIFEPWKAPLSVQRSAGCLIGKDYPFPIVDHAAAVKRCVQWLDEVHEKAHAAVSSHDGVLAPCCLNGSKPQCHYQQQLERGQQQHESLSAATTTATTTTTTPELSPSAASMRCQRKRPRVEVSSS